MMTAASQDLLILIDKPYRWTSFDVIRKLRKPLLEHKRSFFPEGERRMIKNVKAGHAGTLDPLATGLLIVCTGKMTKEITRFQDAGKEYTGTIVIGATTSSYDLEQPIQNERPYDHITREDVEKTAESFTGEQEQTAPVHSAKKIDGRRSYDLARAGKPIELKAHRVTITEFEITACRLPEIDFRVTCTKGTYIRSLAHDFGQKLGTGAYLSALRRTRIGNYRVEDALTPEEFLKQIAGNQVI